MKKLICTLLLIPSLCMAADPIDWSKPYARMGVVTMGAGVAAGAACTLQDQLGQTNTVSAKDVFYNDTWGAGTFIPATSYTMTKICAALKIGAGSPLYSAVTAYIYTSADPKPGTLVSGATSTNTINDALTASYVFYCWNFSGVALTGGTRYTLVLKEASLDGSYTSRPSWAASNAGSTASDGFFYSTDGATWSDNVNSYSLPAINTYVGTCP